MIRFISPKDLIFSDEYIKQPVTKICKSLINNPAKNIILYGERGSGKTTTMYQLQYQTHGTSSPTIYTSFDSNSSFGTSQRFNDQFINHYYELILASKLLHYIKSYHSSSFEEHFAQDNQLNIQLQNEVLKYIRLGFFKKVTITNPLSTGSVIKPLIERFKNIANIQNITLMIDRFDWTDNRSEISQLTLREYLDIFDKSIITTDDESLISDERARNKMSDYSFEEVSYGVDIEIIKLLIQTRIANYNQSSPHNYKPFPINLPNEFYARLIEKTNGNISIILSIMSDLHKTWLWDIDGNNHLSFTKKLDDSINNQLRTAKEIKRMSKQPKLYLCKKPETNN